MNFFNTTLVCTTAASRSLSMLAFCTLLFAPLQSQATDLTIKQAVDIALNQDAWRISNGSKQQARLAQSEAAAALPDPKLSLSLANLPSSNFDLNSEPMTQIQLGIAQSFERGDELSLKKRKLRLAAQKHAVLQLQRNLQLTRDVSLAWLEAYQAQQTLRLIDENKGVFQQLLEISQAGYASALGKSRQQDVIQSELELTQLEDKRLVYEQKLNTAKAQLLEWLVKDKVTIDDQFMALEFHLKPSDDLSVSRQVDNDKLWPWYQILAKHPHVLLVDKNQQIAEQQIALEEQRYRPKWGVKGSYGFRQDADDGTQRADLFSIGLSVELPLFSNQQQDQALNAAKYSAASVRADKELLMRELSSRAQMQWQQLIGLQNRLALYENELLPQVRDQAEVLLSAYTHDDGDFFAVAQARTLELNTQILALKIRTDLQKAIAKFNYFVSPYLADEGRY